MLYNTNISNDYFAFGKTLRSFNSSKFSFTGKEHDAETNLEYFGARKYDADIARWTTNDPKKEKYPNYTPYNYAADNPVYFTDPDGKDIIVNDEKGKAYKYSVGAAGSSENKYIQKTFSVLNELYENTAADANGGASPKDMMDKFMDENSTHDWKITQFEQKNKDFSKTETTYSKCQEKIQKMHSPE
jgi:RHS repeat-associated protein